jgi:predicted amidohydrolase YtcJ
MALAGQLGLTRIITCGDAAAEPGDRAFLNFYEELQKDNALTVRIYAAAKFSPQLDGTTQLAELDSLRRRYKPDDDWIAAGAAKIFLDGVVEGHTAALLTPYADDPSTRGSLRWDPVKYKDTVRELDRQGFQIFTHAIGEGAVQLALDAYKSAQNQNHSHAPRHRIEHVETIAAADIPRFGSLGVIASFQPLHAHPDVDTLEVWLRAVGQERAQRAWAWRSIASAGGRLAFGSDWPVVTLDPWQGMQTAVTRQLWDGKPEQGWIPTERLSVAQAIAGYTLNAAAAGRREAREGSLEAGKLADLIVISQNLFEVEPLKIRNTKVLLTMVGGRTVYEAYEPAAAAN